MSRLMQIINGIANSVRAGNAIDRARSVARATEPGERRLGFIVVIGELFHAETADGKSLGSFPTNEAAADALARAAGLPHAGR